MTILILSAPYYEHITTHLLNGVTEVLTEHGYDHELVTVPGALEIPAALSMAIKGSKNYQGYIALGCVIRGQTSHYDHICNEVTSGLMRLALDHGLAVGNGVLTCENEAQALQRADPAKLNKGGWTANACIEMIKLSDHFS